MTKPIKAWGIIEKEKEMIIIKQWKEFNKYRNDLWTEWICSEGYKKYVDQLGNFMPLSERMCQMAFFHTVIPDKTVEACMDWLISKKKEKK